MTDETVKLLHEAIGLLLASAGRDPNDADLKETPARFLKAWRELTEGAHVDVPLLFKAFERPERYDEMVVVSDIPVVSLCEHHLLPWHGTATVGYIPGARIVGLSKIARCVDAFCRRPQVQERATQQIAEALMQHLEPRGVGVVIRANHSCMSLRGARAAGAITRTSALLGVFRDPTVRAEFFNLS